MNEFLDDSIQTIYKKKYFNTKTLNILKLILIIFLCYSYNKLKGKKILKKLLYKININKYKKEIELDEGGQLTIYKNPEKNMKIETKKGKIFKSDIVFLIIPGGSYHKLGHHERKPIAKKFFSLGYSSATLKYSVYPKCYPANYKQGLKALKILSSQFSKIFFIGFSAGGHLASLLGTTERKKIFNAVGMILCYPVISFVKKVHIESRQGFFGKKIKNNKKNQKLFSIEYRVNHNTLPTFIWTIKTDKVVPYENTLFMIKKLKENKVMFEYKIFENGFHGITLVGKKSKYKEILEWIDLSCKFVEKVIKNS